MEQLNQISEVQDNIKQKIVSHIQNRQKIHQIYQNKGIQTLNKPETIFSDIEEPPLEKENEMIYNMMKNELSEKGYVDFRYLGKGAQGFVILGKQQANNRRYAIKGIIIRDSLGNIKKDVQNQAKNEIDMLRKCKGSPYVINFFGYLEGKDTIYLVFNECQGTLADIIKKTQNGRLNEISAIKYARDITEGLLFIHSQKCLVNDIKLENILIDYNGNAIISDLGLADQLQKTYGHTFQEYVGNILHQAPECFNDPKFNLYENEYKKYNIVVDKKPTAKSEAFSLGILIYVLVQGCNPQLILKKHEPLKYDDEMKKFIYQKEFKTIIDGLTKFNPDDRLSIKEVLIILNGIFTFEFQQGHRFIELMDDYLGTNQELISSIQKDIEFVQYQNGQFYPIIKNEKSLVQQIILQQQDQKQKYEQIIAELKNSNAELINKLKYLQFSQNIITNQKQQIDQKDLEIEKQKQFIQDLVLKQERELNGLKQFYEIKLQEKDKQMSEQQIKHKASIEAYLQIQEQLTKQIGKKDEINFNLKQNYEEMSQKFENLNNQFNKEIKQKDKFIEHLQQKPKYKQKSLIVKDE